MNNLILLRGKPYGGYSTSSGVRGRLQGYLISVSQNFYECIAAVSADGIGGEKQI